MFFGDGYASADDVVGHELTHGVTEHESNLVYMNESGAINESLSDVFGELIDQTNGAGNDSASVKWLMGEDLPIGAIRSMKNPKLYGDPDRYLSPLYYTGEGDNGGVHFNSGVNNKLCYLLTDGGSFNGETITAMGVDMRLPTCITKRSATCWRSRLRTTIWRWGLKQAAVNLGWTNSQANESGQCLVRRRDHPRNQTAAAFPGASERFGQCVGFAVVAK